MALRDINLIAPYILERRCLLRHLFLWCGGIGAVIVLTLAVYTYETRFLYTARQTRAGGSSLQAAAAAAASEMNREQQALNLARREQLQISSHIATQRSYALVLAKLVAQTICTIKTLVSIDASGNKISKIPSEISNLTNLKVINLDKNDFTEFPVELCKLTGLLTIQLSFNKISKIPEDIKKLETLKDLRMIKNPVPDDIKTKMKQWLPKTKTLF